LTQYDLALSRLNPERTAREQEVRRILEQRLNRITFNLQSADAELKQRVRKNAISLAFLVAAEATATVGLRNFQGSDSERKAIEIAIGRLSGASEQLIQLGLDSQPSQLTKLDVIQIARDFPIGMLIALSPAAWISRVQTAANVSEKLTDMAFAYSEYQEELANNTMLADDIRTAITRIAKRSATVEIYGVNEMKNRIDAQCGHTRRG
jgi:hypothetical protein